jgi:N-acetylglutamate synthase-like GNAT family acetyltransferase
MTSACSVRVADLQDKDAITSLLEASYAKLFAPRYAPQVLARAPPIMTKANTRLLTSKAYYVAHVGGQLVGCGGWSRESPGSGEITEGTAHIRHFATHPDWLRRGVGRSLLCRCLEETVKLGIRRLECHSSLVAVEFYLATGFKVVRPLTMKLAPGISIDGVLMRRELVA